jgi:AAA domain
LQCTSQWKSGKTTLLSVLLSRFQTGGQLAGLPVAPAKTVVVSEEGPDDWSRRCRLLDIRQNVHFLCRPFLAKPSARDWLRLINALVAMPARHGTNLVVIDSLAASEGAEFSLLPGRKHNHALAALCCMIATLDTGFMARINS